MSAVWSVVLLQRVSGSGTAYTVAQVVAGVAGAAAVIGLLLGRFARRRRLMGIAALTAIVALLAGPTAYAASAATSTPNGTNPTAGPSTGGGGMGRGSGGGTGGGPKEGGTQRPTGTAPTGGDTQVSSEMITYLKKNQDGATWLVAVATDQTAASIILESGEPVISMGGWSGTDDAMTLTKLKSLVKSGKLHYIVITDSSRAGSNTETATWVKSNATAITTYTGLYRLNASDVT
ncbi:hypothetical protein [Streptomyces sp. NPDC002328]|uniref:hypothetical protein n=1 Tax=Streptomyces sp. NPDC002328 TaxID=3364642 RepID=UPI00368312EF